MATAKCEILLCVKTVMSVKTFGQNMKIEVCMKTGVFAKVGQAPVFESLKIGFVVGGLTPPGRTGAKLTSFQCQDCRTAQPASWNAAPGRAHCASTVQGKAKQLSAPGLQNSQRGTNELMNE